MQPKIEKVINETGADKPCPVPYTYQNILVIEFTQYTFYKRTDLACRNMVNRDGFPVPEHCNSRIFARVYPDYDLIEFLGI
jgi:hypothetical protein